MLINLIYFLGPNRKSLYRIKDTSVIQVLDAEPGRFINVHFAIVFINTVYHLRLTQVFPIGFSTSRCLHKL